MPVFYADASALVKLVHDEPESKDLRAFLADADSRQQRADPDRDFVCGPPRRCRRSRVPLELLLDRAHALLEAVALRPLDRALLLAAGALDEPALRALDAIHVACALDLHPVDTFVTYDERQAAAARLAGLRTMAPGTEGGRDRPATTPPATA